MTIQEADNTPLETALRKLERYDTICWLRSAMAADWIFSIGPAMEGGYAVLSNADRGWLPRDFNRLECWRARETAEIFPSLCRVGRWVRSSWAEVRYRVLTASAVLWRGDTTIDGEDACEEFAP